MKSLKLQGIENKPMLLADMLNLKQPILSDVRGLEEVKSILISDYLNLKFHVEIFLSRTSFIITIYWIKKSYSSSLSEYERWNWRNEDNQKSGKLRDWS